MIWPNAYTANEIEKTKREISELNIKLKILQEAYGSEARMYNKWIYWYCHCYPRGNNRVWACERCWLEQVRVIQTF